MISICIIAKNEAANIEKCLDSFSNLDCEIIVVDTGSTDATCEIAEKYTTNLFSYDWSNNFSKARNFCISKANNDIVLTVDCDEYLDAEMTEDIHKIENIINADKSKVGCVVVRNVYSKNGENRESRERIGRIFSKSHYHYAGAVHEQLRAIDSDNVQYINVPLYLYHTGYDLNKEQAIAKSKRNEKLLLAELDEAVRNEREEELPYIYYQLGKTMNMAGDYGKALEWYSKALEYDVNPKLEYVKDLVECYGYMLLENGRIEDALNLEGIYETFGDTADFKFLMGLIYMKNALFENAIKEFENATRHSECKVQGVNSYRARYNIGVIYECLGQLEMAIKYYRECETYIPALDRLREIENCK